jgi:hypothetical protein
MNLESREQNVQGHWDCYVISVDKLRKKFVKLGLFLNFSEFFCSVLSFVV